MDFLNDNFKSIDDLKRIDSIVNDLNKERDEIKEIIKNKDNDNEADELYEKIQLQSVEITASLRSLLDDFLSDNVKMQEVQNQISALATKYGDLEIFNRAINTAGEIDQLRSNRRLIEQYQVIYEALNDLPTADANPEIILSKLDTATKQIGKFASETETYDLKAQIMTSVNHQLSQLIVRSFYPLFTISETEVPSVESLQKLVALQSFDPINRDVRPLWSSAYLIKGNFELKFRYHYDSNVETNKLDKPEWFFKFAQDWISQNVDDFNVNMSKILQNTIYDKESFKEQYILSIVELLKYKISKNIKLIYKIGDEGTLSNLLMHLIEEMLKNDNYFLKHFNISINLVDKLILSNEDISNRWLAFETQFNFSKFNKILLDEEAFQIDFESVDKAITKPTNSSILVKNLLNNLSLKYELIKNLNFKLKLLTKIQLRILERYYERLEEALDAFNNLFKKFKLLSNKNDNAMLINGVNGVDRLLRIYCSLQYMIEAMEAWNEDLLFIQLSKLIREDTFFNTLIESYEHLSKRVTKTIDEFLNREVNSSFKPYFKLSNWSNLSNFNQTVTVELTHGINQLSTIINYLFKTLSSIDLIPIFVNFEERVIKFFNDNILHLNTFNSNGASQVYYDYTQCIEMLRLFKNLKNYLKYAELFKFLTLVDERLINDLESMKYLLFNEICDEQGLNLLKRDPQLALSIARRKNF